MINNEKLIMEMERRIAHHKQYRVSLLDEALCLPYNDPRCMFCYSRARELAQAVKELEVELYKLYATRKEPLPLLSEEEEDYLETHQAPF